MMTCHISNGYCNTESSYNTESCGYDAGDCLEFNSNYPQCKVDHPSFLGDGICYNVEPYNTKFCGYDGGDCVSSAGISATFHREVYTITIMFIVWFAM
jgi:hypothetical protein